MIKQELFSEALESAKEFIKFCSKQGFMLKKLEYELFIAKIYMKSDSFQEALFQTLKILDKAEEWQMTILILETKLVLSEIHSCNSSYYEALKLLNSIEADVLSKCAPEVRANFYIIKAKVVLYLSAEITTNEVGYVIMKKSVIVDLETCIKFCNETSLYCELRESLLIKGLVCQSLAELYHERDRQDQFKEYQAMAESSSKEFLNIDSHIEEVTNQVVLKPIEV